MRLGIALCALILYCALLLLGAWPLKATERLLTGLSDGARATLAFFSVEPGLALFYRPYDEKTKVRRACVRMRAFDARDALVGADEIGEGCAADRPFKWRADVRAMMLYRLFEDGMLERLYRWRAFGEAAWSEDRFRERREASLYAAAAEYFCRREPAADRVVLGLWRSEIAYLDGATSERYYAALNWTCARHGIVSLEYFEHITPELLNDLARR